MAHLSKIAAARLLVAVLSLGATLPARAQVDELDPTPAQLAEYYAVYTSGDVKHLRVVFDRARTGREDGETSLVRGFGSYLSRKFIVLSREPLLVGGFQLSIMFQGKADAIFFAWVYDRGGGPDRFELRGFKKADLPDERVEQAAQRYRRFLKDAEHAM